MNLDGKNHAELDGDVVRIRVDSRAHGTRWILVSESDWALVRGHRWCVHRHRNTFYAQTYVRRGDGTRTMLRMHRLVMADELVGDAANAQVDHIDGNGLNNTRGNLRLVNHPGTHLKNQHHQRGKQPRKRGVEPMSRFPGVSWSRRAGKWMALIALDRHQLHLGLFAPDRESDAGEAYAEAKALRDAGGTRAEILALAVARGWRRA